MLYTYLRHSKCLCNSHGLLILFLIQSWIHVLGWNLLQRIIKDASWLNQAIIPQICFKFLKFGHNSKECKETGLPKHLCSNCAEPGHNHKAYENKMFFPKCKIKRHRINEKLCHVYTKNFKQITRHKKKKENANIINSFQVNLERSKECSRHFEDRNKHTKNIGAKQTDHKKLIKLTK